MKQFVTNFPGIGPRLLAPVGKGRGVPKAPPAWLPRGRTLLVPCARNALYYGYKALGLGPGDRVLTPAFVCDTVSKPLQQAGALLAFFNVHADGSIDWDHARSLLDGRVKAMVWYHYLGLSRGFDEVVPFCEQHGLYLIEDCAHALFSRYRGRAVGTIGDVAVFSIHKTLPAPRAAALVVNNRSLAVPRPPRPVPSPTRMQLLLETQINLLRLHLQSLDFTRPVRRRSHLYFGERMAQLYADASALHALDEASMLVMHNTDPDSVRRRRARNFRAYLKALKDVALLDRLTSGACPIGFPILVGRGRLRTAFRKRLLDRGVETLTHWPAWLLPEGVARKFPQTLTLAETHVTLPCHHDLNTEQVEYVCEAVRRCL